MLDPQVMKLLATAFAKVARERISHSENITSVFGPYSESAYFFEKRLTQLRKLRNTPIPMYSEGYATAIWEKGVGWCDELSILIVYFSRYVEAKFPGEKIYISLLCTSKHLFCLLHQSEEIHQSAQSENMKIADDFESIGDIFQPLFDNSVVVDAWIYKISLINQIRVEHRFFIKEYQVEQFYLGPVCTCGISFEVGDRCGASMPEPMKEVISRFNYFYIHKLNLETIGDGYQKRLIKVQNQLNLHISSAYLNALGKFIFEIKAILSTVYDGLTNNIKIFYLKKALDYIDIYTRKPQPRDLRKMTAICLGILKIAVLIRDQKPPENLNEETLTISRAGNALMQILMRPDMAIILKQLDLKDVGNLVFYLNGPMQVRYFALCCHLHTDSIFSFIKKYGWPTDYPENFTYIPLLHFHNHNLNKARSDFEQRCSTRPHYLTCLYAPVYRAACYRELEEAMQL